MSCANYTAQTYLISKNFFETFKFFETQSLKKLVIALVTLFSELQVPVFTAIILAIIVNNFSELHSL